MENAHYLRAQGELCLEIARHLSDRAVVERLHAQADAYFARARELDARQRSQDAGQRNRDDRKRSTA